jgi:hypothetical protein
MIFYTELCKPRDNADVVLENDDFESVRLLKGPMRIWNTTSAHENSGSISS